MNDGSLDLDMSATTSPVITCAFLDIGGVLLTNGWDHLARKRAATTFDVDWDEMEARHRLTFEIHEQGKITLDDYLNLVIFDRERSFTRAQFWSFMVAQSDPYPEMIALASQLKVRHGLKIVVVNNEARDLNLYRIRQFKLTPFVDAFVSSCFVHLRKPDVEIVRLALDIAAVPPAQVVYIENTPMFAQIAAHLGIHSILHTDYRSTCAQLASFGLSIDQAIPAAS